MRHAHSPGDWGGLLALVVIWGSAFLLAKVAVAEIPTAWVVAGRLWLAVLLLVPLAWFWARRPPDSFRLWIFLLAIALCTYVLPFLLVTWGLTVIDSGVAGILMAFVPLATLVLAHFLVPGERLTWARTGGFLLGFLGVVVLMGPAAVAELMNGGGPLLPMLAVLGGAICYAVASILARLRPYSDHNLHTSAATLTLSALMLLPLLPMADLDGPSQAPPGLAALAAVVLLGVFSTALASLIYFKLLSRAGPTFVSQLNYLIPLWAVAIGVLLLGEPLEARHLQALGLVLGGIAVTQLDFRRI